MANNQIVWNGLPALTRYAKIEDRAGQIWNGSAFEDFATANIATYAIAMTESPDNSGRYAVTFPAAIPAGRYRETVCDQALADATLFDPILRERMVDWDGMELQYTSLVALATTVTSGASTTVFVLTAGAAVTNAYNDQVISIQDVTDGHWETRRIASYSVALGIRTVTVDQALSFTPAAGDIVHIMVTGYGAVNTTHVAGSAAAQAIRDTMKLAPTAGAPATGSLDKHADDIVEDTNAIQSKLPSRPYLAGSAAATGETQTDAAAALTAYDPPTNAEMEARTRLAAEYALATTALSNLVWTDAKAGYLTGAVALEASLTAIKGAGWSTETLAAIDVLIDAIKAKTDTIPASPAAVGSAMTLATSENVYHADIFLTRDTLNSRDEYTVVWYKNGTPVTAGITLPTLRVVKRYDGSDLVASTAMTEIGTTGCYKLDSTTRLTAGEAAIAVITATIDGSSRTWRRPVGRDV